MRTGWEGLGRVSTFKMLFYVTVLLPTSTSVEDIPLGVDELLCPYETTRIFGHRGPHAPDGVCRCGYVRARWAAQEIADVLYPPRDEATSDGDVKRSLASMLGSMRVYEMAFTVMRHHELHSPDCRVCGGTGRYPEGLEPKTKFDGRVWGGIYVDAWIRGTPREAERYRTTRLEDNFTTVAALLERRDRGEKIVTYALVTPDGRWYERDQIHYLTTPAEQQAFEQGFVERLERHRDCWAIGIECHT